MSQGQVVQGSVVEGTTVTVGATDNRNAQANQSQSRGPMGTVTPGQYGTAHQVRRDFEARGEVELQGRGDVAALKDAKAYDEKEQQSILATFNKWDQAGDGFITEAELRRVLTGLGVKSSQVGKIFQEIDKNKDNQIDYKEFIAWCYNSAPPNIKASASTIKYPLSLVFLEMEIHRNIDWDWYSTTDSHSPYIIVKHPTDKKKIFFTSECGRGSRTQILLEKLKETYSFEFTGEAGGDVLTVEMYLYRAMRGSKFVGSGELRLDLIAPEVAKGLGRTRKFAVSLFDKLRNSKTGRDEQIKTGQVLLILRQDGFHEPWETLKVQYWKRDKLPNLSIDGPNTVFSVLDSLRACPEPQFEKPIFEAVEKEAIGHTKGFMAFRPDLEEIFDSISTWVLKCEAAAKKNPVLYERNKAAMDRAKVNTATDVLQTLTDANSNNFKGIKMCIKFAMTLDPQNRYLDALGARFKSYLGLPADTSLEKMMVAGEADGAPMDPLKLGLTLESDAEKCPDISDVLRYGIRDTTIKRVLGMLGYHVDKNDTRNMTHIYESEGEDMMEMKGLALPKLVTDLMRKVTYFCGEKYVEQMTIPEMILTRNRDPEALLQRFDVVAIPTMAEYDKDWKPLVDPKTKRNITFFGEDPNQPIGGSGWFWILHAAAINIGESSHAEDFDEYSRPQDGAFGGGARWLDEEHYVKDMDALWLNALRGAVHLGVKDFVAFPFGMGAFLRNLKQLDDRYGDDNMMRRLKKNVAMGLYRAMVEVGKTVASPIVHVCLIDVDAESRTNHNVFIEAAADKVKEVPALANLIKIHRNVDCLHLANALATRPPGVGDTDTAPRKVGMLNGANNKLLGNHWFSHGARKAIDENFHRRSGAMCIAGLLLNQATKAEKRGFLELKDNVIIQGGTVVQLLPPEGCGRRFIAQPPRKRRVTSGKFLPKVQVVAYGVLGAVHTKTGGTKNVAPEPDKDTAIVDPAGLPYIRSSPSGAGGASGVIYRWLELSREFPEPVRTAITAATQAKFAVYPGKCTVIHTVGPNFSEERGLNQDEATARLATTYMNTLKEFAACGVPKLRMLPVSSSIFAGSFDEVMPEMTAEALEQAFANLEKEDQDKVLAAESLDMCIFTEKDFEVYEEIFTTGSRKKEKSSGGGGGNNAWQGGNNGGRRGGGRRDRGGGRGRH